MKKNTLLIVSLAALLFSSFAIAEPVTFKTRSGQVYKDAEISKQDMSSITVSYSDGIATIAKEDLPADMQGKLGYRTIAEREAHAAEVAKNAAEAKYKEEAAKVAADKQKKEALAAMPQISQEAAGKRFYGRTREELVAMFGNPVKATLGHNSEDGSFEILGYEQEKGKATFFTIWKNDGFVSDGYFKGVYFHDPSKPYPTAADVAAGLKEYKRNQEERAKVRAGAVELLKQLGGNK